jgi:hypothetical protein
VQVPRLIGECKSCNSPSGTDGVLSNLVNGPKNAPSLTFLGSVAFIPLFPIGNKLSGGITYYMFL